MICLVFSLIILKKNDQLKHWKSVKVFDNATWLSWFILFAVVGVSLNAQNITFTLKYIVHSYDLQLPKNGENVLDVSPSELRKQILPFF